MSVGIVLVSHSRALAEAAMDLARRLIVAVDVPVGLAAGLPSAVEIAAALAEHGFIVNAPRPDTIRLAPPFILSDDDARAFTATFSEVVRRALSEKVSS